MYSFWHHHSIMVDNILSNFQWSIERNPGLLCFSFTALCDCSQKLVPLSQPIICQTKTNHDLSLIFSCACNSLVGFSLSSHWLLKVFSFLQIGCCDYIGFSFKTLNQWMLWPIYTQTVQIKWTVHTQWIKWERKLWKHALTLS